MSEHEVNEMLDWHDKDECDHTKPDPDNCACCYRWVYGYPPLEPEQKEEGCDHYPYSCQGCGGCDEQEEEDEDI